ncbi:MAG: hypothetical protein IJ429_06120 [Lachnospiraceae bacterium]|nr:hypothetical protein [Lachnospiraceae bacterium]
MKGYAKKRLALFLCIMILIPSISSFLPMTAQEVSAKTSTMLYMDLYFEALDRVILIEKGEKFYLGDFVNVYEPSSSSSHWYTTFCKNVKYTSSKKSVISVNSKGLATAKKTGKSTITIKYKNGITFLNVKVVKAGTFKNTTAVKGVRKRAQKLSKSMPSKITLSNGYKYLEMSRDFTAFTTKHSANITTSGTLRGKAMGKNNGTYTKLAVPQAGRFSALSELFYNYYAKHSPVSGTKKLKIASISATPTEIKIKTTQKLTSAHVLAAHLEYPFLNDSVSKKKVSFRVDIFDKNGVILSNAVATMKKGSNVMTIKGFKTYSAEEGDLVPFKLKKGQKYAIGSKKLSSWGSGKTFKVK